MADRHVELMVFFGKRWSFWILDFLKTFLKLNCKFRGGGVTFMFYIDLRPLNAMLSNFGPFLVKRGSFLDFGFFENIFEVKL